MSARPARLRRLLLYTLLCLAALPAMASEPSFALLTLDGQQFAPSWTADGKNYGWQLPGIWPRTFCYAPNRAVLVQTADMPSHLVKMVTMKTRPPSFGAAQWANEKRLDAPSGSVKAFCMSRQSSVIADRFAGLLSAPDASRWIADIRTCSLDFFDPNACPVVPKTFEGFCPGLLELISRSEGSSQLFKPESFPFSFVRVFNLTRQQAQERRKARVRYYRNNWNRHYPLVANEQWDNLMVLWARRHGHDTLADFMASLLPGKYGDRTVFGLACGKKLKLGWDPIPSPAPSIPIGR